MSITDANSDSVRIDSAPAGYPVNLRLTVPFLPRSFFITLIIGPERRGSDRRREERQKHPINTWGNLATVAATWTVFSVAALFAVLVIAAL